MSVLALHHHADEFGVRRYGAAALTVVALHLALIVAGVFWYQRPAAPGVTMQPILVELAPAPAGQSVQKADLAPGPRVQEAQMPPSEPPKVEKVEEQLPPTPIQHEAVIAAPPREEPKAEDKIEPTPPKPQPVKQVKQSAKRLILPSTAAKADRVGREAPASSSGASAAAAASYRAILVAHLERFKQHPGNAVGVSGRPSVSITIERSGRLKSSRLVQSSGNAAIDQAALALVQRAQPMPPFPPEMREVSQTFTAPFRYDSR